jgi:hypothetical protein
MVFISRQIQINSKIIFKLKIILLNNIKKHWRIVTVHSKIHGEVKKQTG